MSDPRNAEQRAEHRPPRDLVDLWEESHYCRETVIGMLEGAHIRNGDDPCLAVAWLLAEREWLYELCEWVVQTEPGQIGVAEHVKKVLAADHHGASRRP